VELTWRAARLSQSPVFPLYDKLTPANLVTSLKQLFADLDAGITALEATTPDSWDALLAPYERLGDRLNMAWGVVEHLQVPAACPHVSLVPCARGRWLHARAARMGLCHAHPASIPAQLLL
jgi:Zn-dependent oligopeptidase